MGEDNNCVKYAMYAENNGEWVRVDYIPPVTLVDGALDVGFSGWSGVFTAEFKVRVPKTRKRFIKFLMANGVCRNEAERLARRVAAEGLSYSYAFAHLTLGI